MYRAADPLPYLTVSAIKVSRDVGGVGHDSAPPTNQGVATATGAVVKFLIQMRPVRRDHHQQQHPVTLAPGKSLLVTVTWTGPTKGQHTVTAVAEPANTIRESSESNNTCRATVTVT